MNMFIEIVLEDVGAKRVLVKLSDIEAITVEGDFGEVHTDNGYPPIKISVYEYNRLKSILKVIDA